ncbi:PREDICTED: uncharacterized protein LOC107356608 [Acropora digitifera]|uniref:uncharacterized protein LOC107356608 n=1 Tax=Acropora digitifera TaxID=70779 RepID=UPI00077A0EFA|nr:PREDICTED: uncharacterized protein LOC107356608 [Acropora digitifera]
MKLQTAFLLFGALSSCLCLESEVLEYQANGQERQGVRSENTFIDSLRHHRVRKSIDPTENITEKINHKYYESQVFRDGQKYWKDIERNSNTVVQSALSDHYLTKKTLTLRFKFPYYGHYLDSVVLTTGGFLYMDVYNTRLITDVQYLAPLMAYFNSKLGSDSKILTLDDGTQLTVQWSNIRLHNNTVVGPFSFQCTLHSNGTIWFAYKQIPIDVDSIPDRTYHPVRVGLSDAFVILQRDRVRPIIYRYFFIYSQVNISKKSVVSGSAVVFRPKPSCVTGDSCSQCMKLNQTTEFVCQWCPATTRCSDGADRHRAEWESSNCASMAVKKSKSRQLAEFQYVAPLMAHFNPSLNTKSSVHHFTDGTEFVVQWSDVIVDSHPEAGGFTFQCVLNKTGEIKFFYHKIPFPVQNISDEVHPVTIGISDAYYVDKLTHYYGIWRLFRTFYTYNALQINQSWPGNNTAVIFRPKPSCITARSCEECSERRESTAFNCFWCHKLTRCSDGFDRHRPEWLSSGCNATGIHQVGKCFSQETRVEAKEKEGLAPWIIAVICAFAVVLFVFFAWLLYAFTHPNSRSGLCLIQLCKKKAENVDYIDPTNSSVFNKVLF